MNHSGAWGRSPLHGASGRRRSFPTPLVLVGALLLLSGCRLAGPSEGSAPAPAAVLSGPALREGIRDPAEGREVARILNDGEALLAERRFAEALERAREVELRYPTAEGSGLALWLGARASYGAGAWSDAESALQRFLPLLSSDDPRYAAALLLRAEVRWDGELGGGIEALFDLPAQSDPRVLDEAEGVAWEWASVVETASLRDLAAEAPPHPRILPVFLVELAIRRHLAGAEAEARELAGRALALSPGALTGERATAVLDGRIDEELAFAAVIGSILPEAGSPSMRELAREIREGIEIALVVAEGGTRGPIRFLPTNEPLPGSALGPTLADLEGEGASGIVGPLDDVALAAAARARTTPVPIISPTARILPEGIGGVYSLTAVDREAGRALAALVLRQGVRQVAVMHPAAAESFEEARWFQEAYQAGGGTILRTLTYPLGTPGLAAPIQEIVRLSPRGLVLILPPEEIETVAPQLAFYGVDLIEGITLFGSASWATQSVLQAVPTRHTDGLYSVTGWARVGEYGPGWTDFVAAYEEHFRRTLRSPVPALGYDAARLLLEAARLGGGGATGTQRALEEIRDFPGATGVLSIVDGRIRRAYLPVRIENRRAIPLDP